MRWFPRIPFHEIEFSVSRSGGPGGQNVNKTNSAVQLRFNLIETQAFNEVEKARLLEKLRPKLTLTGDLLIRSQESRDQDQNRKTCIAKLEQMLAGAYHRDPPRKKTKPTKSSVRKRAESKKARSEIKAGRAKIR